MIRRIARIYYLLPLVFMASASAERIEFNRDIRPILSQNCFHCHGPAEKGRKAGLRLDTAAGAYADYDGARAIVPGDVKASEAAYRIRATDTDDVMPPADSIYELTEDQKALIDQWIREGAVYQGHWAFTPPVAPGPGALRDLIDAGIDAKLETAGLKRSAPANRETLIRRLSLDLRGIPPTLSEVDEFLANNSPKAWESLVDRILASPQCAERLALDWLDTARYADSNGYSIDDHREMWGWRDWVINAFMRNKPYDAFMVEQLAGDLLPDATVEQRVATGFLRNSMNTHEGGTIPEEYRVAYIADKIDTVGTTFLGLTLKCAQCHDHKYDPISQRDYYRFFAFFDSATEKGTGAKNGNTDPVIRFTSPLGNQKEVTADLQERLRHLRALRDNLKEREPEQYAQWKAAILAKAPPALAQPDAATESSATTFRFPPDGQEAEWIWSEKPGTTAHLVFRKSLSIRAGLKSALVWYTCDNLGWLSVNGTRQPGEVTLWTTPQLADITDALKSGDNLLLFEARNEGGVAGFIGWIQLTYADGRTEYVLTDPAWEWRHGTPADAKGWFASVSLGSHGVAPWNQLPGPAHVSKPRGPSLADFLGKPPGERTINEQKQVTDAFVKQASNLTRRLAKALEIEQEIVTRQLKESGWTTVMVMDAPGGRTTRMLQRGQYDQPGDKVTAGVPMMFPQLPPDVPADRLALARWLTSDEHPLTARVAVNRYWQMLFGTGLVKTSEDFGSQGEGPSHPALLDALAVRFRSGGWNVRQLLKEIVLSKTYQQRSEMTALLREQDPYNRLLARAPRQRLQAELVRDNALAISGLLVNRIGGPSVYPHQPGGLWRQVSHFGYGAFTAQAYFDDVGDRTRRRSLYTFWKRTAPPPGMAIFDAPSRETCTARRLVTNTPLQALVLLNDPEYLRTAGALARRMIEEGGEGVDSRIVYAFRLATGRRPNPDEQQLLAQSFARELARFRANPKAANQLLAVTGSPNGDHKWAAYTMVASTVLNLNETITKQ